MGRSKGRTGWVIHWAKIHLLRITAVGALLFPVTLIWDRASWRDIATTLPAKGIHV